MLTNADIDSFRTYVKTLDLKFPVAEIARGTKYSKGNVSDFIKGTKPPSENFLKVFYEKFPKGSTGNMVNEPQGHYKPQEGKDKTILNLSEANIILAKAIFNLAQKLNSGVPGAASLISEVEQKGSVHQDLPFSGNKASKKKRRGI